PVWVARAEERFIPQSKRAVNFTRWFGCVLIDFQLRDGSDRFEAASCVQRASLGVELVDVPKEAFELTDFLVADVIPHFAERKVSPVTPFFATMKFQPRSHAALGGHTDVDHIVMHLPTRARRLPIEDVDPAQVARDA